VEILVLHPGALGDIILSLPALRVLHDHFSDARITLAANADYAAAAASGYADRILSLDALPLHHLYTSMPLPPAELQFWRSYDRVVSWTGSGSSTFSENLSRVHSSVLVGNWKPGNQETRHVVRLFIDSLQSWLPVPPEPPEIEIRVDPSICTKAEEWLQGQGWNGIDPILAMHPGAGSVAKRWPVEGFRQLGRTLSHEGSILVIEGPAEFGLGSDLASLLGPGTWLASHLPLPLLTAVLSHCRLYIGNDSGISHLAAGLKVPGVILFGPTAPDLWAPLGPNVSILRSGPGCDACRRLEGSEFFCLHALPYERVRNGIRSILSSS